ncbi:CMP-N-acetylneuraminate-poly-alpha-2,8-sialyltransferase-like [Branchiostoma lanceolatum]|uniref:CMP-N-acetylneuraminate-poly-alpha-2, 8-sialyltransferase-like n=1 Tax=Branchiostoma lanceolatum TaxID=7740 RepID=UPI003455C643
MTTSNLRVGQHVKYETGGGYFNVTENFFKVTPTESPLQGRHFNSCAVIGDQILYVPAFTNAGGGHVNVVARFMLQYNLQIKTAFPPAGINNVVKSIWKNSQFKLHRPSTGAHMYALAATICDRIHMYGFYPFSTDPFGTNLRYHYYEKRKMVKVGTHNMPEEFRALQMLHQRGALVLHTEPCQ